MLDDPTITSGRTRGPRDTYVCGLNVCTLIRSPPFCSRPDHKQNHPLAPSALFPYNICPPRSSSTSFLAPSFTRFVVAVVTYFQHFAWALLCICSAINCFLGLEDPYSVLSHIEVPNLVTECPSCCGSRAVSWVPPPLIALTPPWKVLSTAEL